MYAVMFGTQPPSITPMIKTTPRKENPVVVTPQPPVQFGLAGVLYGDRKSANNGKLNITA